MLPCAHSAVLCMSYSGFAAHDAAVNAAAVRIMVITAGPGDPWSMQPHLVLLQVDADRDVPGACQLSAAGVVGAVNVDDGPL